MEDKEILYDHYKDTFEQQKSYLEKRDKMTILHDVLKDYKVVAERATSANLLGSFQIEVINGLHDISRGDQ